MSNFLFLNKNNGHTLIQSMMVLVLISIMLALALGTYHALFKRNQATVLRDDLIKAIETARQTASIRSIPITLCHSQNHRTCSGAWINDWIIFMDIEKTGQVKDEKQILTFHQTFAKGKLYWRGFPQGHDYLLFNSYSMNNNENGTFWYCSLTDFNPLWAIVINKTGRLRVQMPDKKGLLYDGQNKLLTC